jgi:hypothetical protein
MKLVGCRYAVINRVSRQTPIVGDQAVSTVLDFVESVEEYAS